jgi:hypothetical protein
MFNVEKEKSPLDYYHLLMSETKKYLRKNMHFESLKEDSEIKQFIFGCPFYHNFLGEFTPGQESALLKNIKLVQKKKYDLPVYKTRAYSVNHKKVGILFIQGIKPGKVKEIRKFLDEIGGNYNLVKLKSALGETEVIPPHLLGQVKNSINQEAQSP